MQILKNLKIRNGINCQIKLDSALGNSFIVVKNLTITQDSLSDRH